MLKRHNNTIYKLFLKSKKTIKVIPSSITRIGLIIYIEDPEEVFSIDYIHIKNTNAERTTVADIITTSYPVRNNAISIINLDASQVSISRREIISIY